MTREDILNMEAGAQMDNLIATSILGYELLGYPAVPKWQKPGPNGVELLFSLPRYSVDIAAAWKVMDWLRDKFFRSAIYQWDFSGQHTLIGLLTRQGHDEPTPDIFAEADTAPLAICRASLLAVLDVTR